MPQLLFLLEISDIPWTPIVFALLWIGHLIYNIATSKAVEKANEKRFKDIEEHHKEMMNDISRKLDHLRTRAATDLDNLKETHQKQISDMRDAQRETNKEIRDLRDIIIGLKNTVDMMALTYQRRERKAA